LNGFTGLSPTRPVTPSSPHIRTKASKDGSLAIWPPQRTLQVMRLHYQLHFLVWLKSIDFYVRMQSARETSVDLQPLEGKHYWCHMANTIEHSTAGIWTKLQRRISSRHFTTLWALNWSWVQLIPPWVKHLITCYWPWHLLAKLFAGLAVCHPSCLLAQMPTGPYTKALTF